MKLFILHNIILATVVLLSLLNKDSIILGTAIFALMTYLPGLLLFHLINYKGKTIMEHISISFGLGILFLYLTGLLVNQLLPMAGISHPLSQTIFLFSYTSIVYILTVLVYFLSPKIKWNIENNFISFKTILFIFLSLLFPLMGISGAILLNNTGSNVLAISIYILIAFYSIFILIRNHALSSNKITFSLFIISLTLLVMNSFRGWYNTGHDIQQEFFVFQLTHRADLWDINTFKDAYNACLSLTILPTIYANVTKINDYFIYKTIYQIIFSLTVVNIFYILHRNFSKSLAFIASLTFVFFPTFLTDMPMLNRQELAFFYVSLMVYVLFDKNSSKNKKTFVFMLMSSGMILSHYSTSYITIGIFTLSYFLSTAMTFSRNLFLRKGKVGVIEASHWERNMNIFMILFLLVFVFFWNMVFTQTSDHVQRQIIAIANNMLHPLHEKEKSGESLYSIIGFNQLSQEELLKKYISEKTAQEREKTKESEFYDKAIYSKYPLSVAKMEILSPVIKVFPIQNDENKLFSFVSNLRQLYAKIIQLLIIIGILTLPFYKRFKKYIHVEYYILAVVSILIILIQLIVPQNSVDYGILRLFQQSLMFFSIFIVLGFYWIVDRFKFLSHSIKIASLMSFTIFYFLLLSGVIPQIFGGYYPQLPLNNTGMYYDLYYSHTSDIITLKWIGKFAQKGIPLQTDSFDFANVETYANIAPVGGTLPAILRKDAYVYLNYFNTRTNTVFLYYRGSLLSYKNPVVFLNDNKNLIYNNGEAKVYK